MGMREVILGKIDEMVELRNGFIATSDLLRRRKLRGTSGG
jgi:hypothetical protein